VRAGLTHPPYLHSYVSAAANAVDQTDSGTASLLGHSASGPLLPAIALTAATPISGLIYVDAALPYPGQSWFDTAPSELGAHLRELARDGQLPPWNEWFPSGAVDELVADLDLRRRFLEELRNVPLSYFDETLPSARWQGPSGYLQLSPVYSGHAARAEQAGWPVRHLELCRDTHAPAAAGIPSPWIGCCRWRPGVLWVNGSRPAQRMCISRRCSCASCSPSSRRQAARSSIRSPATERRW